MKDHDNGETLGAVVDDLLARIDSLRDTLSNPDLPPGALEELLPPAVHKLALSLVSPPHYQSLIQTHPNLAGSLSSARERIVRTLPGLNLASAAALPGASAAIDDGIRSHDFVRSLRSAGHANVWFGEPAVLIPAAKVVVTDMAGERVLDAVIDWADLLFLAESCLAVLKDGLEAGQSLVRPEMVREFLDSVPESVTRFAALLQAIGETSARYDAVNERDGR
jgi:hypothetical protein